MKNIIAVIFAGLMSSAAFAAGGANMPMDQYRGDLSDQASLQTGAKYFYNYCFGCHAVEFARYNRVAKDLGISDDLFREHLMFTETSIGSLMKNPMTKDKAAKDKAKAWFGATPPDLTLVARVRGTDWLYTYLRSFYKDESRPWGVNNTRFPNVGMPHVMLEVQGLCAQEPVAESHQHIDPLTGESNVGCAEYAVEGSASPEEFDQIAEDMVNFLEYMGEPVKLERQRLGLWVIGFLLILLVFAVLLNREYWKDIH